MRILEATWLFLIYMPCLAVGMTNARRDALREETKDVSLVLLNLPGLVLYAEEHSCSNMVMRGT